MARLGELMQDPAAAAVGVIGRWRLLSWEIADASGDVVRPLGDDAVGLLIYAPDGSMAVQIVAADRPQLETADPLAGTEALRARAYSTCLAYAGRYEVRGETIVHAVDVSLFPDWTGAELVRVFELAGDELTLRTTPIEAGDATVTVELRWAREATWKAARMIAA